MFHLECGRQFLCHNHFCHFALSIVSRFPTNQGLSSCCIRIVLELNRDEHSRSEVLHHDGVTLVVKILNLVQVSPKLVEEALRCIRSICSSENESLPEVYSRNVIGCVLMSILSYPSQDEICAHGIRSMEWIAASGGAEAARVLLDEGVFEVAADVLQQHTDADLIRYLCSLLTKVIRNCGYLRAKSFVANEDRCLKGLQKSGLLQSLYGALRNQSKNESLIGSYSLVVAVLASNSTLY